MTDSASGRRSGRASASKALKTLKEGIKKAKVEDEEDDLGDISYEDSEEEFQVPKKKKKTFGGKRSDDSDEDSDDLGKGRKTPKKRKSSLGLDDNQNKSASAKKSKPGPKSKMGPKSKVKTEMTETDIKSMYPVEKFNRMFSKWKDPMTYTCEICNNFTTSVVTSLSKHLKDYHKIRLEDYDEIYGVEERDHTCGLCKVKVCQSGEKLEAHFAAKHADTNLKQYFEKHILPVLPSNFGDAPLPGSNNQNSEKLDIKTEKGSSLSALLEEDDLPSGGQGDNSLGSDSENCQDSVTSSTSVRRPRKDFCRLCGDAVLQEVEALRSHYEKVHVTDKDRELQRWSQKVTFKPCKLCQDSGSRTLGDFKRHVEEKHGYRDTNAYVRDHMPDGIFRQVVYHACLICQSSVLHDHGRLSKHLMDKCKGEGTSLAAYYKDHVVPSGQANPGRGGKSGNNQQKREITPVDPDVQQKYVKWLYQVEWECSKCQQVFNQYCQLRFHMKSDHQASMPFMKKGWTTHPLAKKAVYHTCKVCDAKVLHDNEYLGPHYTKEHDMGGLEYFGKHLIDDNGELITS